MSSPRPLLQKIDCIRLSVADLEAGLQFYRDRLGHSLIWRTPTDVGLCLPGGEAEIVLHSDPADPEIDLLVASADQAAARFEAAGGQVLVPPFDIQIGRAALVQDPWGNRLILLDATKGYLLTDENGNVIGNTLPAQPGKPSLGPEELELRLANEADVDALCSLYYEFHEFHVRGVPSRLRSLGEKDRQDWTRLRSALGEIFRNPEAAIFLALVSGAAVGLVEVYLKQDTVQNPLIMPHRYGFIFSDML